MQSRDPVSRVIATNRVAEATRNPETLKARRKLFIERDLAENPKSINPYREIPHDPTRKEIAEALSDAANFHLNFWRLSPMDSLSEKLDFAYEMFKQGAGFRFKLQYGKEAIFEWDETDYKKYYKNAEIFRKQIVRWLNSSRISISDKQCETWENGKVVEFECNSTELNSADS